MFSAVGGRGSGASERGGGARKHTPRAARIMRPALARGRHTTPGIRGREPGSGFVHGRPPLRTVRPGPERHVVAVARGRADPSLIRFGLRPRGRSVTPVPFLIGRDVPHGGTLFMRRRVSARLAFGHTPARPCRRKAAPSCIWYTVRLPERQHRSSGPASALVAGAAPSAGSRQGDDAFRVDPHRGVHEGRRHPRRSPERRRLSSEPASWRPSGSAALRTVAGATVLRLPSHPMPAQASAAPSGVTPVAA